MSASVANVKHRRFLGSFLLSNRSCRFSAWSPISESLLMRCAITTHSDGYQNVVTRRSLATGCPAMGIDVSEVLAGVTKNLPRLDSVTLVLGCDRSKPLGLGGVPSIFSARNAVRIVCIVQPSSHAALDIVGTCNVSQTPSGVWSSIE